MDRGRGSDTKSSKQSAGKKISMDSTDYSYDQPGLFLANPNANDTNYEQSTTSPLKSPSHNATTLSSGDSKERLVSGKSKSRTKSPSFFKMLVGKGLRKMSVNETDDGGIKRGDSSSFSDNEEPPLSFSPAVPEDHEHHHQGIEHIATLPRKNKKLHSEKVDRSLSVDYFPSLAQNGSIQQKMQSDTTNTNEYPTDCSDDFTDASAILEVTQPTPSKEPTVFHSVGLQALEMLHNQLQILVIQDCDSDMADVMHEQVSDSFRKQISELQKSLSFLQQSDQNLRLSLKIAEMRAQEAEMKLHHSSQRGLRLEEKYFRLEKEYNKLLQNYYSLEKHLQKQALLHQMQLSPNKKVDQRPNSVTLNTRRMKTAHNTTAGGGHSPRLNPVKRHNSSEFLSHHQRQKNANPLEQQALATADINPCNTLPTRLHSGSLSHTETRV